MRRLRQLHLCLPDGRDLHRSGLKRATINRDECVECYACYNGLSKEVLPPTTVRFVRRTLANFRVRFEPEPDVCPTTAFEPDKLEWPRVVRRAFSDPRVPHESTGVSGRGTEEVKTNDVTDRVGIGQVGFTIELGRPGIGARFRDFQEMSRALAKSRRRRSRRTTRSPPLMTDVETGTIREDILNEKVMCAIIEIKVPVRARKKSSASSGSVEKRSTPGGRSAWACAATKMARKLSSRRSWKSWATTRSAPRPISAWDEVVEPTREPARETADV